MKASSPSRFKCVLAEKEHAGELQRDIKEQIETVRHVKIVQVDSASNISRIQELAKRLVRTRGVTQLKLPAVDIFGMD